MAARGTYESPVFDAGSVAQWGKLRWQGEKGAGDIALRTRIRQQPSARRHLERLVGAAARTGAQIPSPNARFLQYEAALSGTGVTLENVSAAYLPQNNPPIVRSVTVLTTATPAGAAAKTAAQSGSTASAATTPYSVTVTDTGDAAPVSSTGTPDADAVARRPAAADDLLAGRRSRRRQAGLRTRFPRRRRARLDRSEEGSARHHLHDRRRCARRRPLLLQSDRVGSGSERARVGERVGSRQFARADRQHAAGGPDSVGKPSRRRSRCRLRRAGLRLGSAPRRVCARCGPVDACRSRRRHYRFAIRTVSACTSMRFRPASICWSSAWSTAAATPASPR